MPKQRESSRADCRKPVQRSLTVLYGERTLTPPEAVRRISGDKTALRTRVEEWTKQEAHPDFQLPLSPWPPPEMASSSRGEVPALRSHLEKCTEGGRADGACHDTKFKLAMSLLGGRLSGHYETEDDGDERTADEIAEGLSLMRSLADEGSQEGMCAWAFILYNGSVVEEDPIGAVRYHRQAASAGYGQSMHELGTMSYLGVPVDGTDRWLVPIDGKEAVRWFRMSAEQGISSSMYLLGDCLHDGFGVPQDADSALGWFVAAGELGHRGARSRTAASLEKHETYQRVAGFRASRWVARLSDGDL